MQQQFYLGIDASKGYADFMILNHNKQALEKNFQLDDTFDGHCLLFKKLEQFFKEHPDAQVNAALESTGGYENNWFHSMVSFQSTFNMQTARLNPRAVANLKRAAMNRNTTDAISARYIAEYLIAYPEKISYQTQGPLASLRKQFGFIQLLTKQRTQLFNQLESLIYSTNPELLSFCKDGVSQWVLKLLLRYPTAKKLANAKASSVAKIPYISLQKAQDLVLHAQQSVACHDDPITQNLVIHTAKQILQQTKIINEQSKLLASHTDVPEIDILKTFTGIGDYSAIGLLLEIQSVKRFDSVKKLTAFFGIHPVFKISGDGIGGFRMSKQGRKIPRQILFMVAFNAIQSNDLIRDIYQYHTKRGMNKMAAIGLCMHKILRIIYGMLKNNTPFDPETDRKNRQQLRSIKKKVSSNSSRRYQPLNVKAPISRRQTKRRMEKIKEQGKSQSDYIAENGIIAVAPTMN